MTGSRKDPFDVDALRIDPADPRLARHRAKARKAKWERKFVQFPWLWAERLQATNRGSTYRLALHLLYEHWRNGGRPIKLTNAMLAGEGVSRRSKCQALPELERFGLVRVERHPKKSPVVTLLIA
jgi:hypothetical protein